MTCLGVLERGERDKEYTPSLKEEEVIKFKLQCSIRVPLSSLHSTYRSFEKTLLTSADLPNLQRYKKLY